MRPASAQMTFKGEADVVIARVGVEIEQSLGGERHRRDAVATLRGLFLDERLLHRVQAAGATDPLGGDDLTAGERTGWLDAGRDHLTFDEHRAGTALFERASEFRGGQPELVAQDEQQRCGRVRGDGVNFTIDGKLEGVSLARITHCFNESV